MSSDNKNITFKGSPLTILGKALKVGDTLPTFTLTANDMSDLSSTAFADKPVIVSVVPSVDTPVCSIQTKRFNQEAGELGSKVAILTVSRDLPFAQKRWCAAEGVENLTLASDYKHQAFGEAFGAFIKEWGLLARALFVADKTGKLVHVEYVSDVSSEPDYSVALQKVRELL